MPNCSFPFFKRWIEQRFGDLCQWHDSEWVTRDFTRKVTSDFYTASMIAQRGYPMLAYATFILWFTLLGTLYWTWKKYKGKFK